MRSAIAPTAGARPVRQWWAGRCIEQCREGDPGHAENLQVLGEWPAVFCPDCGTGLFYTNEVSLPGLIDIQSATYDNPNAVPAQAHIQVAERIGWMEQAHELPTFGGFLRRPRCRREERRPAALQGRRGPAVGAAGASRRPVLGVADQGVVDPQG